jgi:dihydroorotate dehydrogenase
MFERTLSLVKRYRRLLDEGTPPPPKPSPKEPPPKPVAGLPSADEPGSTITEKIESVKESLAGSAGAGSAEVGGSLVDGLTRGRHEQKVIFATGGITNGKQALEILNAGASVAQIYTALIYGGVGTVSRIKREMRGEMGMVARKG